MTINIPCWTTSKEEANKLVDELSEGCYEYGKDESKEKMLDVFYKTKALKNYVGIMQGRIELLNARIAELEAELKNARELIGMTPEPAFPAWIPVSERLPKVGELVLVYDINWRIITDFLFLGNVGSDGFMYCNATVTHWMPLPELPEAK